MKYRKRPIVVEAEQYDRGRPAPEGVCFNDVCGAVFEHVHTSEGLMRVRHLDWIITGTHGEKYPCRRDIFEKIYEPVQEQAGI